MIIENEEKLKEVIKNLKAHNNKIITTNGVYDLVHEGHLDTLEKAKSYGDILIVLINSDSSVKRHKGNKRPIIPEISRAKLIDSLKPVDFVYIFHEDTPLESFHIIKPDFHIKGGSYIEERVAKERELLSSWGGKCIYLPMVGQESTTAIIEKIVNLYKDNPEDIKKF